MKKLLTILFLLNSILSIGQDNKMLWLGRSYQYRVPALFDNFPTGSYEFWGFRRGIEGATKAVRARRSSDNAEMDIGFDFWGNFDVLTAFIFSQGSILYCTTVYGQLSGFNWTQSTAANQPQITLNARNGNTALSFNAGLQQYMTCTHYPSNTNTSVFCVMEQTGNASVFNAIVNTGGVGGSNQGYQLTIHSANAFFFRLNQTYTAGVSSGITLNNLYIVSGEFNNTNTFLWVNGTQYSTTSSGLSIPTCTTAYMGAQVNAACSTISTYLTGYIFELAFCSSIPVYEANMRTNQNAYFKAY